MTIVIDGTTGITTPDIISTTSTLGALTQALDLGSTGQIVFPATQSASSDANTLDDYEEGNWTPTYGSQGTQPTVTYNTQGGKYIKVGRLVYFQFFLSTNSFTGGTGSVTIKGWPFAFDVSGVGQRISVGTEIGGSWATTNVPRGLNIYDSAGAVLVYRTSASWSETAVEDASNSSGGYNIFEMSGCYLASA